MTDIDALNNASTVYEWACDVDRHCLDYNRELMHAREKAENKCTAAFLAECVRLRLAFEREMVRWPRHEDLKRAQLLIFRLCRAMDKGG